MSQFGLVTIIASIFIILKLLSIITWPWLWVLSPLWIAYALLVFLLLLGYIIAVFENIGE